MLELRLFDEVEKLASELALRTLVFASKEAKLGAEDPENDYTMLGFTAVEDLL